MTFLSIRDKIIKKREQKEMQEEMQKKALAFFKKDELSYADMRECVAKGNAEIFHADENAVLLKDAVSDIYMLAGEDEKTLALVLQNLTAETIKKKSGLIVAHGEKAKTFVESRYQIKAMTPCFQTVYQSKTPLPVSDRLIFRKAGEKELERIISEYHLESPENLKTLAQRKKINCAFLPENGQEIFVGFIGRHPEGSMGLLLVFPDYRRHGYAVDIESHLVNEILSEGRIPYGHIIEDNEKSMNLQKKLGFSVAEKMVYWLRLE